jgi:broad specificity phosphatase PhoE
VGTILLVRHGQASLGAANYDQLSMRGELQARGLGAALADRGYALAPLCREPCADNARQLTMR